MKRKTTNVAIKIGWGAIVTAMALPTAWNLASQLPGIITPVCTLGILATIASTPLLIGCKLATEDFRRTGR